MNAKQRRKVKRAITQRVQDLRELVSVQEPFGVRIDPELYATKLFCSTHATKLLAGDMLLARERCWPVHDK